MIKETKVIVSSLHVIDNHTVTIDLACKSTSETSNAATTLIGKKFYMVSFYDTIMI